MCFILGFIKWSFSCVHRTVTFLLTAWLVLMVVYVSALAIVAGIAYGYDYCLAEYTTLSSSNVQLELKPREYGPDLLVGRTGNIVDLMAEGKDYRVRPRSNKMKSAKKDHPQWLFKAHQVNTSSQVTSSKKKEMSRKEAKKDALTDTAMNFRKADLFMPFRYMKKPTVHRESSKFIRTTDKANADEEETEMDDKKVELGLPPFISAIRSTEKTVVDEVVTETHEEEADLKLMPYIYAKWFSKPLHTTRSTEEVNMGEEETEIYEKKAERKLVPLIYAERFFLPTLQQLSSTATLTTTPETGEDVTEIQEEKADNKLLPFIPEQFSQLANHRVSLDPTHTTKEAEIDKEVIEEYQEETGIYGEKLTSTLPSSVYVWKSPNPDITMTLSTNIPTGSVGMRWFLPQSTSFVWRPITSDTFYKTSKDDERKTTWNPYYPEMKIRVFDRPSFDKSVELPAMRYWDTITRTSESSTSDDNIDYKKFIYF